MTSRVGIVGYGRCGQLAARLLAERFDVVVTDAVDRSAEAEAAGVGWGAMEVVAAQPRVVFAVPIRALARALEAARPHLGDGALVVDLCSVKSRPMAWMADRVPPGVRHVGTHPLFGPDSVSEQGVAGQRIAVCAAPGHEDAAGEVVAIATDLGLDPIEVGAETHDRQMARSQAIVFLLAHAMRRAGLEPAELGTPSERRVYEALALVAGDTDELYQDILAFNPHVPKPVRALCAAMQAEVEAHASGAGAGMSS